MDEVVLDASVIAKLFIKEEWSEVALALKDSHVNGEIEISAPSLLRYELVNTLKYNDFAKEEIKLALEIINDYGFSLVDLDDSLFDRIADLSTDYDITAYDASYIALAEGTNAILYTADGKLLRKIPKLSFAKHVKEFDKPG